MLHTITFHLTMPRVAIALLFALTKLARRWGVDDGIVRSAETAS